MVNRWLMAGQWTIREVTIIVSLMAILMVILIVNERSDFMVSFGVGRLMA